MGAALLRPVALSLARAFTSGPTTVGLAKVVVQQSGSTLPTLQIHGVTYLWTFANLRANGSEVETRCADSAAYNSLASVAPIHLHEGVLAEFH